MTMHVSVFGRRRVIVAADGRQWNKLGVIPDNQIKLHQAGVGTLVGTVGFSGLSILKLSRFVADICSDPTIHDDPKFILDVAIRQLIEGVIAKLPTNFWSQFADFPYPVTNLFEAFAVKRQAGGRIDLKSICFPLREGRSPGQPVFKTLKENFFPEVPFSFHAGHSPSEAAYPLPNPDDDLTDTEVLDRIDEVFALTEASKQLVGPATDVAIVEDSGVRWLRAQSPSG